MLIKDNNFLAFLRRKKKPWRIGMKKNCKKWLNNRKKSTIQTNPLISCVNFFYLLLRQGSTGGNGYVPMEWVAFIGNFFSFLIYRHCLPPGYVLKDKTKKN